MKLLALIPIGMQVLLSGCIVWYSGLPEVNHSPGTSASGDVILSYVIDSTAHYMSPVGHYVRAPTLEEKEEAQMRNVIKRQFSHWTEVDPSRGPLDKHVAIYIESSSGAGTPTLPPNFYINPIYNHEEIKYFVRYDLYSNGQLSRYGPYRFFWKATASILFIPFLWVNWLTPSKEEAFSATVQQFLVDAQRDGHL